MFNNILNSEWNPVLILVRKIFDKCFGSFLIEGEFKFTNIKGKGLEDLTLDPNKINNLLLESPVLLKYGNIGNIKIENISIKDYKIDISIENVSLNFYMNTLFAYKNIKESQTVLADLSKNTFNSFSNTKIGDSNIHWEPEPDQDNSKSDDEGGTFMSRQLEKIKWGITIKNLTIEISQEIPTRPSPLIVFYVKQLNQKLKNGKVEDSSKKNNSKTKTEVDLEAQGIQLGINKTGIHSANEQAHNENPINKSFKKKAAVNTKASKKPSTRKMSSDPVFNNYNCITDSNISWIFSFCRVTDTNKLKNDFQVHLVFLKDIENKRDISVEINFNSLKSILHLYDLLIIKRFMSKIELLNAQKYLYNKDFANENSSQDDRLAQIDAEENSQNLSRSKQGSDIEHQTSNNQLESQYLCSDLKRGVSGKTDLKKSSMFREMNQSKLLGVTNCLMHPYDENLTNSVFEMEKKFNNFFEDVQNSQQTKPTQIEKIKQIEKKFPDSPKPMYGDQEIFESFITHKPIFESETTNDQKGLSLKKQVSDQTQKNIEKSDNIIITQRRNTEGIKIIIENEFGQNLNSENEEISEVNLSIKFCIQKLEVNFMLENGDFMLDELQDMDYSDHNMNKRPEDGKCEKDGKGLLQNHFSFLLTNLNFSCETTKLNSEPLFHAIIGLIEIYHVNVQILETVHNKYTNNLGVPDQKEFSSKSKISNKSIAQTHKSFVTANQSFYSIANSSIYEDINDSTMFKSFTSQAQNNRFSITKKLLLKIGILTQIEESMILNVNDESKINTNSGNGISLILMKSNHGENLELEIILDIDQINIKFETSVLEYLRDEDFIDQTLRFVTGSNQILHDNYIENNNFEIKNHEKINFYYDVTELELQKAIKEIKNSKSESDSEEKIKNEECSTKNQALGIQKPLKFTLKIKSIDFNMINESEVNVLQIAFKNETVINLTCNEVLYIQIPQIDFLIAERGNQELIRLGSLKPIAQDVSDSHVAQSHSNESYKDSKSKSDQDKPKGSTTSSIQIHVLTLENINYQTIHIGKLKFGSEEPYFRLEHLDYAIDNLRDINSSMGKTCKALRNFTTNILKQEEIVKKMYSSLLDSQPIFEKQVIEKFTDYINSLPVDFDLAWFVKSFKKNENSLQMYLSGFYVSIQGKKANYKDDIKKYTFIEEKNTVKDSGWNVITTSDNDSKGPNKIIHDTLKVIAILETNSTENKLLANLILTVKYTGDHEKETVPISVKELPSTNFTFKNKNDITLQLTHKGHLKQVKEIIPFRDLRRGEVIEQKFELNFFDESITEILIVKMKMIKENPILPLKEYNKMEQQLKRNEVDEIKKEDYIHFMELALGGLTVKMINNLKNNENEKLKVEILLDQIDFDFCSQNNSKTKDEAFKSLAKLKSERKWVTPKCFQEILESNNNSGKNFIEEKIKKSYYFIYSSFYLLKNKNSSSNDDYINSIKIRVNSFLPEFNLCYDPVYALITINQLKQLVIKLKNYDGIPNKKKTADNQKNKKKIQLDLNIKTTYFFFLCHESFNLRLGAEILKLKYKNYQKNEINNKLYDNFRFTVKDLNGWACQNTEKVKQGFAMITLPANYYLNFISISNLYLTITKLNDNTDVYISSKITNNLSTNNSNSKDTPGKPNYQDVDLDSPEETLQEHEEVDMPFEKKKSDSSKASKENESIRLILTLDFIEKQLLSIDYLQNILRHYKKHLNTENLEKNQIAKENKIVFGYDVNHNDCLYKKPLKKTTTSKKANVEDEWDIIEGDNDIDNELANEESLAKIEELLKIKQLRRTDDLISHYTNTFEEVCNLVEYEDKWKENNTEEVISTVEQKSFFKITVGVKEIQLTTGEGFLGPNELEKLSNQIGSKSFIDIYFNHLTFIYKSEILCSSYLSDIYQSPEIEDLFKNLDYNGSYFWVKKHILLLNLENFKVKDLIQSSSYKYFLNKDKNSNKDFLNLCLTWNSENWTSDDINSSFKNKDDFTENKDLTIQEVIDANITFDKDPIKESPNKNVESSIKKKKTDDKLTFSPPPNKKIMKKFNSDIFQTAQKFEDSVPKVECLELKKNNSASTKYSFGRSDSNQKQPIKQGGILKGKNKKEGKKVEIKFSDEDNLLEISETRRKLSMSCTGFETNPLKEKLQNDQKSLNFKMTTNFGLLLDIAPINVMLNNNTIDFFNNFINYLKILFEIRKEIREKNYSLPLESITNDGFFIFKEDDDLLFSTYKKKTIGIQIRFLKIHQLVIDLRSMTTDLTHKANLLPKEFDLSFNQIFISTQYFNSDKEVTDYVKNQLIENWQSFVLKLLKNNAKNLPIIGDFVVMVGLGTQFCELTLSKLLGIKFRSSVNEMKFTDWFKDTFKFIGKSGVKIAGLTLKTIDQTAESIGYKIFRNNLIEKGTEKMIMKIEGKETFNDTFKSSR